MYKYINQLHVTSGKEGVVDHLLLNGGLDQLPISPLQLILHSTCRCDSKSKSCGVSRTQNEVILHQKYWAYCI